MPKRLGGSSRPCGPPNSRAGELPEGTQTRQAGSPVPAEGASARLASLPRSSGRFALPLGTATVSDPSHPPRMTRARRSCPSGRVSSRRTPWGARGRHALCCRDTESPRRPPRRGCGWSSPVCAPRLPASPAAVPTRAPPCTRTRTRTKDPSAASSLHASPAPANWPAGDRMGRRVTFLTPRATVSHPRVPFAGRRPHFRQHNSAPSGRSSKCGRGSDRCPPGRRHSLGDVSHWRGVLSLSSPTQAGASEPRKLRGCKGSAGRLAGGAGGRESRGQGGQLLPDHPGRCRAPASGTAVGSTRLLQGPRPPYPVQTRFSSRRWCGAAQLCVSFWKAFGSRAMRWQTVRSPGPILPGCPQASAALSAWNTRPWIVPRLSPPPPHVFSRPHGPRPS